MANRPAGFEIRLSSNAEHVSTACSEHGLTGAEFAELQRLATAAKATAYCPYSRFRVGATTLAGDGRYSSGANVENASSPVGTCAERVAFGRAVTEGHRGFRAVAVATDISPPASPCGMCRQFMREFCELRTPVIMFDKNGDFVVVRLETTIYQIMGPVVKNFDCSHDKWGGLRGINACFGHRFWY